MDVSDLLDMCRTRRSIHTRSRISVPQRQIASKPPLLKQIFGPYAAPVRKSTDSADGLSKASCASDANFGEPIRDERLPSYFEALCSRSLTLVELIVSLAILVITGIVSLESSISAPAVPASSSRASVPNSVAIDEPYRCEQHRTYLDHESGRTFDTNC